ncbi:hypothetical protein DL765_001756 [Monosporascus sp. GIB2]|nr:hypothetical protein DL765_001756 [Monosporascus sp. GIB2]
MTSSNSDTELLTEHFGYPPVSLIDDIINSVNILAERALNSVEQGLLNAPPAALGFRANNGRQQRQPRDAAAAAGGATDPAEAAKDEIEAGTHQLETLLCASIDRNFDKFEIYVLRNILCVRPADVRDWIRLSHYEGLDFSSSSSAAATSSATTGATSAAAAADDATAAGEDKEMKEGGDGEGIATADPDVPTLEGINRLRRKLRESMRLNALLTAEHARNERLLRDLRRLVGAPADSKVKRESASTAAARPAADDSDGLPRDDAAAAADAGGSGKSPFAFLHRKADLAAEAGPDAPLSTTTAFTLTQMQALRALSASLRTLAPDLAPPPGDPSLSSASASVAVDDGGDGEAGEGEKGRKKSWRRERLEYVEGAARRHLESVQGLELGRGGEVRDGEWQGGGRSLARGEVEGLERIVSLLGGGGGGAGAGEVQGAGDKKGRGGEGDGGEEDEDDGGDRMDES